MEDSIDALFAKKHDKKHDSAALQCLVLFPCRYCTAATYHKLTRPGIWDHNGDARGGLHVFGDTINGTMSDKRI